MTIRRSILRAGVALSLVLPGALAQAKPVVTGPADLPRDAFPLTAKPSAVITGDGAAAAALADALEADARGILETHSVAEAATERSLLDTLRTIALLERRWQDAIDLGPRIRQLQDKPAERVTDGLVLEAYAMAALEAGGDTGPAFQAALNRHVTERLQAVDLSVAGDALRQIQGTLSILSPAILAGQAEGQLDPTAEAMGNVLDRDLAGTVVRLRYVGMVLPVKDGILAALAARLADTPAREDRWTPRLVDLSGAERLTQVVIGVWDSGLDTSLFKDRLWTNPGERPNGRDDDGNGFVDDIHGVAFDEDDRPTQGSLKPMGADADAVEANLGLLKGFLDLQASLDTSEARMVQTTLAGLAPEEVTPFLMGLGRMVLYIHGTAIADVAAADNPAARLAYARFDYRITAVPEPESEQDVERSIARINSSIDYLAATGARVVNMSFSTNLAGAEEGLMQTIADPEERRRVALRRLERVEAAFQEAFARHPGILFIAAAGNEDEDVDGARSVPSGLNAPNLITVGAVDPSLQPTGFTSFGASVDLYANGFEVTSRVPGGRVIPASGTSQSAPGVANLAAKLLALDPDLDVAGLRRLMEGTATAEGDRGLKVIHPAAAIAALRGPKGR